MSKKLQEIFTEAWDANAAMLGGEEKIAILKTAMKAIAERDYIDVTDEQIEAAIKAGVKEMEAAKADFLLQTKMMR
ncbi:MAG: phage holin, LLH family [Anaerovoracaceae bacterium]